MNRLKKDQKAQVKEFASITGEGNALAIEYLKAENWDLSAALNRLYNGVPTSSINAAPPKSDAFFGKYSSEDVEEDIIDCEGVAKLIEDLKIDPSDKALIAFAFLCRAANMGEFTRQEFTRGCQALGVSCVSAMHSKLPTLRAQFDNDAHFAEIYDFTFGWACDPGKKILPLETGIALWQLLFQGKQAWPFTDAWCEFLREKHKRPLSGDTWKLLLEFKRGNHANFDNFDDSQAWPVLIDEFVESFEKNGS